MDEPTIEQIRELTEIMTQHAKKANELIPQWVIGAVCDAFLYGRIEAMKWASAQLEEKCDSHEKKIPESGC